MAKNISDGLLDSWAQDAMDDLGEKGWRDIDPNSMILIVYSVQKSRENRLIRKTTKPLWWLLGVVGTGVIWYIIGGIFGVA